jgi:hypothetical protein
MEANVEAQNKAIVAENKADAIRTHALGMI